MSIADSYRAGESALFFGKQPAGRRAWPLFPIKNSVCRFLLPCLLALFLGGCQANDSASPKNDLALAEEALKIRDTGDAEMYFLRYLRKNPAGTHRWKVWQRLLDITLNMRQDKNTAKDYLEIMLVEFPADAPRRRAIQTRLAALCNETRDYPRAVSLWEALAADPGTPDEQKAVVYRELSQAYLRRLEFTPATDVLDLCLQLKVSPPTKADCLYEMAQAQILTEELGQAEKTLLELLRIPEASQERRVLAVFTLADVKEQQERVDEARTLFESIRETYPNEKVIEMRLTYLKDKKDAKKPMVDESRMR